MTIAPGLAFLQARGPDAFYVPADIRSVSVGRSEEILDIAQEMIQTRGYNAFSFQDISSRMGIKKASVQFYFSKKADLGVQVVRRYADQFQGLLDSLDANPELDAMARFEAYLQPFHQVSQGGTLVCLCGVLGGEFVSLPESVQREVAAFFQLHEIWLNDLLENGRKDGVFQFSQDPQALGKIIFSALQGALIIARSRCDESHFHEVAQTTRKLLQNNGS